MKARRVGRDPSRQERVPVIINGRETEAFPGESVAAVLLAASYRVMRRTRSGSARGLFCGIGLCHDCLVTVDGVPNMRACLTAVRPGIRIEVPDA